jgi:elongation factor 1-alpha
MNPKLPKVNVVAIGHIDHGKSTLIGRLVYESGGLKPDRLEEIRSVLKKLNKEKFEYAFILDTFQEEREGAMTIDTVQIPFNSQRYVYNFIDCPGHKEFVKNMISGASQGEMAMFVVSAKPGEGVQDQSKEHAWLTKKLGIERMVVAVNKMDTVNYGKPKFDSIVADIKDTLGSMGYDTDGMNFVPVSAMEGDNIFKKSANMEWYTGPTLVEALDESAVVSRSPIGKPLRIPVQDSYKIGQENVIVGRVESGKMRVGDEVILMPSGERGTVKSIKVWNQERNEAAAGDNIGFSVSSISEVRRGDVFGDSSSAPNVSREFDAEVFILEKESELKRGGEYIIRCGTSSIQCKVKNIANKIDPRSGKIVGNDVDKLVMDDAGTVRFTAADRVVVEKYSEIPQLGRIIIRDEGATIGIGVVVGTN